MNAGGIGSAGVKVVAVHTVAFYRPSDGRVEHVHQSVVLEGGAMTTREEAERRAADAARRAGHAVEGLSTLYLDRAAPPGRLNVDLDRNELVPISPPAELPGARRG
jgi:hypothetical protein